MMEEIIQAIRRTNNCIVNEDNWKPFLLREIFTNVCYGSKLDEIKTSNKNPIINFIGRSGYNNGLVKKVDLINSKIPYKKGSLTLSLGGEKLGACFLQNEDFYTGQNIAVLQNDNISNEAKFFIACCITLTARNGKYEAFNNELNKHINKDFYVNLPSKNNKPDFEMMEKIIVDLKKQSKLDKINKLKEKLQKDIRQLDTSNWEEVSLINEGAGREIILKLKNGNVNLVSSTENNNGVVKKVSWYKKLFDGNKLTLAKNGSVGNVFYQAEPFCATSDVVVLSHPQLTKNSALFIKTILEKQTKQFDYNNKINSKNLDKITLKLPSFEFMEKFMEEIKL